MNKKGLSQRENYSESCLSEIISTSSSRSSLVSAGANLDSRKMGGGAAAMKSMGRGEVSRRQQELASRMRDLRGSRGLLLHEGSSCPCCHAASPAVCSPSMSSTNTCGCSLCYFCVRTFATTLLAVGSSLECPVCCAPMTGVALGERGFEIIPKLASAAPSESPAKRKRVDLAEDERDENDGDVAPNPPSTKKARAVAKCSSCADFSLYTPAKWRIGSKAHNRPCPLRAVEEVPATSTLKSAPAERDRYANAGACSKASNTAEFRGSQLRLGF